jgi:hypothetical protein
MSAFLFSLIVGWPAILATCIVAGYGLARANHRYLVASALMAIPFSWTLSGFPFIRSPIFLLPLLLYFSGYAMSKGREMIAWFIAVPFYLVVILLFLIILAGNG